MAASGCPDCLPSRPPGPSVANVGGRAAIPISPLDLPRTAGAFYIESSPSGVFTVVVVGKKRSNMALLAPCRTTSHRTLASSGVVALRRESLTNRME